MPRKPLNITKATQAEILGLGGRAVTWEFDPEVFDGEWWRFEVAPDEVESIIKGFRRQSVNLTGNKIASRRKDGFVYLRVTEEKWSGKKL